MRALTAAQSAVEALNERTTRLRAQIDRTGAGSFVDLSDYQDLDWVDSVDYDDNGDNPVGQATVRLRREWHDLSLSPLMAASKLNTGGVLVFPKREIKVEAAIIARGLEPAASDWMEVFRGRIDKISWHQSPMEIKCRDLGGDLQDGWIETQKVYGTTLGRPIEDVIQDILTDAKTADSIPFAVTLYSINGSSGTPFVGGDSPGFLITKYKQGREPVMDAIQKLARLIGWECRYRWNANDSAFRLTLYEPAREVRSRGTITLTGDPLNNETFAIDGDTYTAKTSGASTDEYNIVAGDQVSTCSNIADMLNAGTGATKINAWADGNTVLVEWQAGGTVGDSVTFTEATTNMTMDGGGTLGGTRGGVDPTVDHTFKPERYYDVEALDIDVSRVRNTFSGTFQRIRSSTEITINAAAAGTYTRTSGSFISDGFRSGDLIQITGFDDGGNNGQKVIASLTATVITVVDNTGMTTESGDGDELIRTDQRTTVKRRNNASRTKYHPRPLILTEGATSQIDSIDEMIDLLDAADNDLSEPDIGQVVRVPYFPWGESGDFYRFEANGQHYDSDQDLSAVVVRHVLRAGSQSRSMIATRGKPALGPTRWLEAEGAPGVGPPPDIFVDPVPDSLAIEAALGQIIVTYDDPRTMDPPIEDWAATKCYVSTDSGFTPSAHTLRAQGRQTRFEINNLIPGTTYYAKLQIIDWLGNVAATSTQVTIATERVGPYHENTDGQQDQLCRNNDFNIFTKGTTVPPDFWNELAGFGVWDTDIEESTSAQTGARSIEMHVTNTVDPALESDLFPFTEADLIQASALVNADNAANEFDVNVKWYEDDKTTLITTASTTFTTFGTGWTELFADTAVAPANTRYARVTIVGRYVSTNYDILVDRIGCVRASPVAFRTTEGAGTTNQYAAANTNINVNFPTQKPEEIGITWGGASTREYTIDLAGFYQWVCSIFTSVDSFSTSHLGQADIQHDDGSGYSSIVAKREQSINQGAGVESARIILATPVTFMEVGDLVRVTSQVSTVGGGGAGAGDEVAVGSNVFITGRMLDRTTK